VPEVAYSPKANCVPEFTVLPPEPPLAKGVQVFGAEQYFGTALVRLNSTLPATHLDGSEVCAMKL
jgi:hypothetical protein